MAVPEATEEQPAIAAAVIVHGSRILLIQRRIAEGGLSWQFQAGAVEKGETYAHAAVRETAEETALVVEPIAVLGERAAELDDYAPHGFAPVVQEYLVALS